MVNNMPCRSDGYFSESQLDKEVNCVAQLLIYVYDKLKRIAYLDYYIKQAAVETYPKISRDELDKMTSLLCSTIKGLSKTELDDIVYNGRSKESRRLADWWDKHQEFDKLREEKERKHIENAQHKLLDMFKELPEDNQNKIINQIIKQFPHLKIE
jgi:hypothetical protein